MSATRRHFLGAGAGSLGGLALATAPSAAAGQAQRPKPTEAMTPLDYGRSFIANSSPANAVRFWVESRTRLIDAKGKATDFYQCGSCKSEHTFAAKDLLQKDNFDFLPILGNGYWLIFRRPARVWNRYRQVVRAEAVWGKPIMKLVPAAKFTALDSWERIRDATAAATPIVTQTELVNERTGLRAIIECPTKTMNISLDRKMYQVDTGPVAFPDLTKPYPNPIECLSLAFVVFNAADFADFVIEQPTPVGKDKEAARAYHYSSPFSVAAQNRVLAVGV